MYTYKGLSEAHLDAMLALQCECLAEPGSRLMASSREAYERAFQFDNFAFGALLGGELVGFSSCAVHNRRSRMNLGRRLGFSDDQLDRVAHINAVLVSQAHRRRGIAAELIARSLDALPARCAFVLATTSPDNASVIRLLDRFGFHRVGEGEFGGLPRAIYGLCRNSDTDKGPWANAPAPQSRGELTSGPEWSSGSPAR